MSKRHEATPSKTSDHFLLSMSEGLAKLVKEEAKKVGMSPAELIRYSIVKHLANNGSAKRLDSLL